MISETSLLLLHSFIELPGAMQPKVPTISDPSEIVSESLVKILAVPKSASFGSNSESNKTLSDFTSL